MMRKMTVWCPACGQCHPDIPRAGCLCGQKLSKANRFNSFDQRGVGKKLEDSTADDFLICFANLKGKNFPKEYVEVFNRFGGMFPPWIVTEGCLPILIEMGIIYLTPMLLILRQIEFLTFSRELSTICTAWRWL